MSHPSTEVAAATVLLDLKEQQARLGRRLAEAEERAAAARAEVENATERLKCTTVAISVVESLAIPF